MILETIPPLMDSLQIVWMLSCHYNTNERMVSLMERIAWQLCERVDQVIDVHKLFKYVWIDLHFLLEVQILDICHSKPFIQIGCFAVSV